MQETIEGGIFHDQVRAMIQKVLPLEYEIGTKNSAKVLLDIYYKIRSETLAISLPDLA